MSGGYYHQDERDTAATYGCLGLIAVAILFVAALLVSACSGPVEPDEPVMDGSTAGANAVTLDDLEREYAPGAYPANGEGAALSANTTYGRGVGMVDMVTYDSATNVMIRHYGQVQEDGTIRWYAAETVLGEDGLPRVMPRG